MWWRLRAKSIRNVVWAAFNGRVQLSSSRRQSTTCDRAVGARYVLHQLPATSQACMHATLSTVYGQTH